MGFDLNTAETQDFDLIPDNTIVPVKLRIRNDKHFTKAGDAIMADCEFTVIAGPFARKKFWGLMMYEGNGSKGHDTAVQITMQNLRAMIESAHGLKPSDDSERARKARQINSIMDVNGLEFVVKVKFTADDQYGDKNELRYIVTPGSKDYTEWSKELRNGGGKPAASSAPPREPLKPTRAQAAVMGGPASKAADPEPFSDEIPF